MVYPRRARYTIPNILVCIIVTKGHDFCLSKSPLVREEWWAGSKLFELNESRFEPIILLKFEIIFFSDF